MSKTSMLTMRIDPDIKRKLEKLYSSFGLTVSDAINMFIHQSLIVGGLPFELKDPFYKGELNIDKCSSKETISEPTIADLKRILPPIAKNARLKTLFLFGSRARGDNRPNSDYDFCYELKENASLLNISGLYTDLKQILGKEIDLVSKKVVSKKMPDVFEKDAILIYKDDTDDKECDISEKNEGD